MYFYILIEIFALVSPFSFIWVLFVIHFIFKEYLISIVMSSDFYKKSSTQRKALKETHAVNDKNTPRK